MSQRESLDEENAQALLQTLVNWLLLLVGRNESTLVVKKICSTLAIYFLRFSALWPRCIAHVMCSFCAGQAIPPDQIEQHIQGSSLDVVSKLARYQILAILWFSSALVEDVGKTDANSIKQ